MHNSELHALYSLPNIIRNFKSRQLTWVGHACMELSRNAYRVLVGRPEGMRPLGRPRHNWEDIEIDLREVGCDTRDWTDLAEDRVQWKTYLVLPSILIPVQSFDTHCITGFEGYKLALCCIPPLCILS